MMHHSERQQPRGMVTQILQIEDDQQQALRNESRKQRHDAEIPHVPGVEAGNPRGSLSQKKRKQDANGSQCAVGRNEDCADVKEDWMHQSKDTAFGLSGVARGWIGKGSRIRPTGPWKMRW